MTKWIAAVSALSIALFGCGEASGPPSGEPMEIDFNAGIDGGLPRLDDPLTPEQTRELREGFDWSRTTALPETDPDGRIALRYAIVYISTDEQRTLLDGAGHHSPRPLFAVERERWEGEVGRFGFFGDGEGLFHFIILPASTYNLFRDFALDGDPPFEAFILRNVPVPEADNGDGSIDHQWLADRGFRLRQ